MTYPTMMTPGLLAAATAKRAELSHLIYGATLEQLLAASTALGRPWTNPHRSAERYDGAQGIRLALGADLDRRLYYGAATILSQRGPASDGQAQIEIQAVQRCIDALAAAGARAADPDPDGAFASCGGSVSYV